MKGYALHIYVTKCRKSIVMIVGVKKGKSEQKKVEFYIVEKANKSTIFEIMFKVN